MALTALLLLALRVAGFQIQVGKMALVQLAVAFKLRTLSFLLHLTNKEIAHHFLLSASRASTIQGIPSEPFLFEFGSVPLL